MADKGTPPPLYHGTRAAFRGPGGLVLPGEMFHKKNHPKGRNDLVFVTPDLDLAWDMANSSRGTGKPRVLVVQPFDLQDVNTNLREYGYIEFGCTGAKVLKVLTEEPV